jgi:hypothetical protein
MNTFSILVALALAGVLHIVLVENAYDTGYEDAEMALGTTAEQCFAWWFGQNKKQFEHEMKQFCKRCDI